MRIFNRNVILLCFLLLFACERIFDPIQTSPSVDCTKLINGLLTGNDETARAEINKLFSDLKTIPTKEDPIGQKENFTIFEKRLHNSCKSVQSELTCYACMYSNPPQSLITLTIDSLGVSVKRFANIWTPSHTNMSCIRIYY